MEEVVHTLFFPASKLSTNLHCMVSKMVRGVPFSTSFVLPRSLLLALLLPPLFCLLKDDAVACMTVLLRPSGGM